MHRRPLPGAARPSGLRRLPPLGILFLALAALVALADLSPVVAAAWSGVTELIPLVSDRLPTAARSAAMVMLPAAALWARARTPSTNPWLWKGALMVALVELARIPADLVEGALVERSTASGDTGLTIPLVVASLLGLVLAVATTLGVWALAEGLRDAGARFGVRTVGVLAIAVVVFVAALFGPSLMAGIARGDALELGLGALSVVVNTLFLFALALLAAAGVRGAMVRLVPPRAWVAGALGALAVALLPVVSLLLTLANQATLGFDPGPLYALLRVGVLVGWPLVALGIAAGMGAYKVRPPGFRGHGHRLLGGVRATPAPGAGPRR